MWGNAGDSNSHAEGWVSHNHPKNPNAKRFLELEATDFVPIPHFAPSGSYELIVTDSGELPEWVPPKKEYKDSLADLFATEDGEWLNEVVDCYVRPKEGKTKHAESATPSQLKTNRQGAQ